MSRTLGISNGSGDSLNVSVRCGCRPKACHTRLIVMWLKPVAFAISRVLQCVAPRGVVSSVRTITSSIACPDPAGRPGTRFVEQASHAVGHEARPPLADRRGRHPQAARHHRVVAPLGARQHDSRASRQRGRRPRSMRQRFQFPFVPPRSARARFWATDGHAGFSFILHYDRPLNYLFHIFLLHDTSGLY